MLTRWATVALWRTLALASTALGIAGVFLPVLPTTPFLLVAAWAAGKGWPQFEAWLLAHPRLGPPIHRWRDHRAVPRSAKWGASVTMAASAALLWWSAAPPSVQWGVTLFLLVVATWLWRRPET
jgi:uncharacterized protein